MNALRRLRSSFRGMVVSFGGSSVGVSRLVPLLLALFWMSACLAAPDAGAKARGSFNFYSHGAHAGLSSARAHTETYQRYLQDTHGVAVPAHAERFDSLPPTPVSIERPAPATVAAAPSAARVERAVADGGVSPEVAREASDAIADDIERVQRHVARMLKSADSLGDEAVAADLQAVEKQLAIARRAHATLHAHHAEETISPSTAMELAQRVNDALRSAHAIQDRVVRRVGDGDDAAGR